MLNQYNSKTSKFYYKYKRIAATEVPFSTPNLEIKHPTITPYKLNDIDIKLTKEEQYKYIDKKLEECHWFDAQVFRIYYLDKHSLNSMSKATQINRNTLYKSIRQVTDFLKKEYKEDEQ